MVYFVNGLALWFEIKSPCLAYMHGFYGILYMPSLVNVASKVFRICCMAHVFIAFNLKHAINGC